MELTLTHHELTNRVIDLMITYPVSPRDAHLLKVKLGTCYMAERAEDNLTFNRAAADIIDLCDTIAFEAL